MNQNTLKHILQKTFLEENGFGWVFDSEGVHIIEVEND